MKASDVISRIGRKALLTTLIAGSSIAAYGQAPKVNAIVNAASYKQEIAQGSLATAYGEFPLVTDKDACGPDYSPTPAPFPTTLCGLQITANGTPVPLAYATRNQVNFFVPRTTGTVDI